MVFYAALDERRIIHTHLLAYLALAINLIARGIVGLDASAVEMV
jgi:hypothetical protein